MVNPRSVYIGTFLIAFSTLALEITLSRLMSVMTWYHLAFFAISTAMLGMTAGSVTVYLKPEWFKPEDLGKSIAKACMWYALSIPFSLILMCIIPLELRVTSMSVFAFLFTTAACSTPFYFAGMAISALLTKYDLPIGKLYAADLIGAALGCLLVLGGLEVLDAPSLILLCGPIGILASVFFAKGESKAETKKRFVILGVFCAFILLNTATKYGIRPFIVKGTIQGTGSIFYEKWNSFSRVIVKKGSMEKPSYWGPSEIAPEDPIYQYSMVIDGDAGTTLRGFKEQKDIEHLKYDVTNIAHFLRPSGPAAVIGVGGGRDVQSALYFGHDKVKGIEVNPVFIDMLTTKFRDFAGLADRPGVELIVDEARSYLSRDKDKYSVLMMSLIDTWASTGAGAFSLSENALYTIEAWEVFLKRLSDDGIFTVSRWFDPASLGETGRILSLAMATMYKLGVENPRNHLAMLTSGMISTLLVSKNPMTDADVQKLQEVAQEYKYGFVLAPGVLPQDEELRKIVSSNSRKELDESIKDAPLNYSPPTDENPYFFNMLKLSNMKLAAKQGLGVARGNLLATVTLVGLIFSLSVLAFITIILPLFLAARKKVDTTSVVWSGVAYFSLIGAGFMFVEIALIQRLSVFLGHPVYALGILLFTIILSTGLGSWISEVLPLTKKPYLYLYPVAMAVATLVIQPVLNNIVASMITSPMASKIGVSILVLFPLGIIMGLFFPTGLKIVKEISNKEMPWYWALNGVFGVLTSALAVFFSIYMGISTNFYVGAFCYFILVFFLMNMDSKRNKVG